MNELLIDVYVYIAQIIGTSLNLFFIFIIVMLLFYSTIRIMGLAIPSFGKKKDKVSQEVNKYFDTKPNDESFTLSKKKKGNQNAKK